MIRGQQIKIKKIFIFLFTFKKAIIPPCSPIHVMARSHTKGPFVSRKVKKSPPNRIGFYQKNTKYGYKNARSGIYIVVLYESKSDILTYFLYRICRRNLQCCARPIHIFIARA